MIQAPWPHQAAAVPRLLSGSQALLWEVRMGKTRACCDAYNLAAGMDMLDGAVVVAPVNAKHVWLRWLERECSWARVHVCEGLAATPIPEGVDIVIVNPDILSGQKRRDAYYAGWLQALMAWVGQRRIVLILDEVHEYGQHPSSSRYKAVQKLSWLCDRTWMLTGTEYESSAFDLHWMLKLAGKTSYPFYWWSYDRFGYAFCEKKWSYYRQRIGKEGGVQQGGYEYRGLKDEARFWAECALLVDKRRKVGDFVRRFDTWVGEHRQAPDMSRLAELRSELGREKVAAALAHLEATPERPALIGAWHVATATALATKLRCPLISGSTTAANRARIAEEFQAGRHEYLVCNLKAGGTAIELSRARQVVVAELDWSARTLQQFEGRGQDPLGERAVPIHYLLLRGSVDEFVWDKLLAKGAAIDRLELAAQLLTEVELSEVEV